jgi:hypothetical protein
VFIGFHRSEKYISDGKSVRKRIGLQRIKPIPMPIFAIGDQPMIAGATYSLGLDTPGNSEDYHDGVRLYVDARAEI